MGIRDHGYYGYAFLGARPMQIVALVAIIGMTGHFVSQDSHAHIAAPSQLVATLVVSSLGLLWSLLSFTAYDDSHIPYFVTGAIDLSFMVPFIVVAAILSGPLSAATCSSLPVASKTNAGEILAFQVRGTANATAPSDFILFVGNNQTTCYTVMAVWGLVIALCILFALSGFATGLLFLGKRRAAAAAARASAGTGAAAGTDDGFREAGFEMGSSVYAAPAGKSASDYSESYHAPDSPPIGEGHGAAFPAPPYPASVTYAPRPRAAAGL